MTEFESDVAKLNAEVAKLRRRVKTLHTLALELLIEIKGLYNNEGFEPEQSCDDWKRWNQAANEETL